MNERAKLSCEQCVTNPIARGLCRACYSRAHKRGLLPPREKLTAMQRFNDCHVKAPNGCWLWTGGSGGNGNVSYGSMRDDEGKMVRAHRFAYGAFKGPITAGLEVCHTCDNGLCVNPDHLQLGSHRENMIDMVIRGRVRHGSRHKHAKLTEAKVAAIKSLVAGGMEQKTAAEMFGVSPSTVTQIINGHNWKHVK